MLNKKTLWMVLLIVGLVVFSGACKGKKSAQTTPEPEPSQQAEQSRATTDAPERTPVEVTDFKQPSPSVEELSLSAQEINASGDLLTIYFAFDESDLTETARASLRQNANWLKTNADWAVVIQGHCDERGTIEYNLALGQRRANAVREYLASLGVNASRVRTVSYGEERPADPGHTEASWAKNRRAETLVEER